jgi:predicted RNA polymerase sigma factor
MLPAAHAAVRSAVPAHWPRDGMSDNPVVWLSTTANWHALDDAIGDDVPA